MPVADVSPRFTTSAELGNWCFYQHTIKLLCFVRQWRNPETGLAMVEGFQVKLYIDGVETEDLDFVSDFSYLVPSKNLFTN